MAIEEAAIITARSELPGFRFHPTEEELLNFYLKSIVSGKKLGGHHIIGFLNIYKYDPIELPGLAKIGEREWYFFVPRDDRKHAGGRPNRTTEKGFWKATGSDRQILDPKKKKIMLGLKKTLVFYEGRAPRGRKTDWVMNEYRLPADHHKSKDDQIIVLCKIYMKARSLKALEHRAAIMEQEEEETKNVQVLIKKEDLQEKYGTASESSSSNKLINLAELQVPKFNMQDHWTQDSFWTQFSPWIYSQFYPLPAW